MKKIINAYKIKKIKRQIKNLKKQYHKNQNAVLRDAAKSLLLQYKGDIPTMLYGHTINYSSSGSCKFDKIFKPLKYARFKLRLQLAKLHFQFFKIIVKIGFLRLKPSAAEKIIDRIIYKLP